MQEIKKITTVLPTARVHGLESYEQDYLPLHCLLDEGFSVPGGVGTGVSFFLSIHIFFFFGVVVNFGASSCTFHTFFLEGMGTTYGDSFLGLGLFFFCFGLFVFLFLRPSTIRG
jgi:hypothetical protein